MALVKILVAGLPAELVREIGLRLGNVEVSEFDNAQKMGRAASHSETGLVVLSDAIPTEDALYVARRAKDAGDEMRVAFILSMQQAENALHTVKDVEIDRFFLAPVDTEEMLREMAKLCRVEVRAPQASHSEHIAAAIFQAWNRARPEAFRKIDKLDEAATALLDGNLATQLRTSAEREANAVADVAGKFGLQDAARLARDIAERFASASLAPADVTAISEQLLALRQKLVAVPSARRPSMTAQPQTARIDAGAGADESPLAGRCVLVVDDEPLVTRGLTSLLGKSGLSVTALNDPLNFWTVVEETKPNLILLDLEMPRINGTELCRVIRNDRRWSELPVIFLTGHTDQMSVQRVFAAGADDYVGKPFVPAELMMRIESRLTGVKARKAAVETDPLTGLATATKATELIERFLRLARRKSDPYTIAVLRVDGFASLTKEFGRALGDAVLRAIGVLLPKSVRAEDVPGWWGAADFTIGMYGSNKEFAAIKLTQICAKIAELDFIAADGRRVHVSCSAGVAEYQIDGDTVDDLREAALKAVQ
jgi:diguanylate cyclase (GGDEF)-like protein